MGGKRVLTEMPWTSVRDLTIPTTTGKRVTVDCIDFRVEEMIRDKVIEPKAAMNFFAPLPGTRHYINQYGEMTDTPKEGVPVLPDIWWKYAYGTYRDKNVKAGMYPRSEQGELSQEELDQKNMGQGESLKEALDRVFRR